MALSVENTGGNSPGVNSVVQISNFTVTSANKLIVLVGIGGNINNPHVTSITFGADNLTYVGSISDSNWCNAEIWEKHNPTIQTSTITVTINESVQLAAGAIGFIDASVNLGTFYSNVDDTANPSVTITDSANGDIVVSTMVTDLGPVGTTTENGNLIYEAENINDDIDFNSQWQNASGPNTVCSWTSAAPPVSNFWVAAGVAVKPLSAGTNYFISGRNNTLYIKNNQFGVINR